MKKDVLYACTQETFLFDSFAPVPLSSSLPEWWEKLPAHLPSSERQGFPADLAVTARSCYSLQNLFKRALVIPAWSDMIVSVGRDGGVEIVSPDGVISQQHPVAQYAGMMRDRVQCKIISPWLFSFHDETNFLIIHPFYHYGMRSDWEVMPGVIEFFHQNNSHINLAINPLPEAECTRINAGDPLAYLIPLCPQPVRIEPQLISELEFSRVAAPMRRVFRHRRLRKRLGITFEKLLGRPHG